MTYDEFVAAVKEAMSRMPEYRRLGWQYAPPAVVIAILRARKVPEKNSPKELTFELSDAIVVEFPRQARTRQINAWRTWERDQQAA